MFDALSTPSGQAAFTARWPCGPQRFAPWGEAADEATYPEASSPLASEAPVADDLWASGFAAGLAQAKADLARDAAAMDALLAALDRLAPMPAAALLERLEAEMHILLTELVGTASIDEALLIERCAALADMATGDGEALLHAHPEDAAILMAAQPPLTIISDPKLPRGELLLIEGAGEAAAGPRTMLADWAVQSGELPC